MGLELSSVNGGSNYDSVVVVSKVYWVWRFFRPIDGQI
jgi:hypothetical protein